MYNQAYISTLRLSFTCITKDNKKCRLYVCTLKPCIRHKVYFDFFPGKCHCCPLKGIVRVISTDLTLSGQV